MFGPEFGGGDDEGEEEALGQLFFDSLGDEGWKGLLLSSLREVLDFLIGWIAIKRRWRESERRKRKKKKLGISSLGMLQFVRRIMTAVIMICYLLITL